MTNLTFHKATKEQIKARIALVGPSGSGKTYTALTIGTALGKNVALIDTENGSASKYSDRFNFSTLILEEYSIQNYINAIRAASANGFDVLIIDSLSHAWSGPGGALESVEQSSKKFNGNKWAGWSDVTPQQNLLVDTILRCNMHLIVTMRSKTEWVIDINDRGKSTPRKIGTEPIQRKGIEYEFDIVGDMDIDHNLIITKTRCEALDGVVIQKPTSKLADTIAEWLNDGEPEPDRESELWQKQIRHFHALGTEIYEDRWETVRAQNVHKITRGMYTSSTKLKQSQLDRMIAGMKKVKAERDLEKSDEVDFMTKEQ